MLRQLWVQIPMARLSTCSGLFPSNEVWETLSVKVEGGLALRMNGTVILRTTVVDIAMLITKDCDLWDERCLKYNSARAHYEDRAAWSPAESDRQLCRDDPSSSSSRRRWDVGCRRPLSSALRLGYVTKARNKPAAAICKRSDGVSSPVFLFLARVGFAHFTRRNTFLHGH